MHEKMIWVYVSVEGLEDPESALLPATEEESEFEKSIHANLNVSLAKINRHMGAATKFQEMRITFQTKGINRNQSLKGNMMISTSLFLLQCPEIRVKTLKSLVAMFEPGYSL